MTQLTKEEREFDCPNCRTRFRPMPKLDPRELVEGSIIDSMQREIDRLSARCEELEKEKGSLKVKLCEHDLKLLESMQNLSALLDAVEPIIKFYEVSMLHDKGKGRVCGDEAIEIDVYDPVTGRDAAITQGDLRRLSTVADGIRGKG